MSDKPTRVVVCAAIKIKNYSCIYPILGPRHHDATMINSILNLGLNDLLPGEQGFIDQFGVFMDRFEALAVATAAGQINTRRPKTEPLDRLFSEDLY